MPVPRATATGMGRQPAAQVTEQHRGSTTPQVHQEAPLLDILLGTSPALFPQQHLLQVAQHCETISALSRICVSTSAWQPQHWSASLAHTVHTNPFSTQFSAKPANQEGILLHMATAWTRLDCPLTPPPTPLHSV